MKLRVSKRSKTRDDRRAPVSLRARDLRAAAGGVWDYSNVLGELGEQLEMYEDWRKNGISIWDPGPSLDDAADQVNQGWV